MADFYGNMALVARRLLRRKGQEVTVTRRNAGSIDPITGLGTQAPDTVFTANAAVLSPSEAYRDDTQAVKADYRILLSADTAPELGDVITTADGDFTVVDVKTVNPAGTVVVHELLVTA